jgi:hypothetical protein
MPDENGIPTDVKEELLNESQARVFLNRNKA